MHATSSTVPLHPPVERELSLRAVITGTVLGILLAVLCAVLVVRHFLRQKFLSPKHQYQFHLRAAKPRQE